MPTVKIGYKRFKVSRVEEEVVHGNRVCYGRIDLDNDEIVLSKLYSQSQQECVLIHEVLHGIDDVVEAGLSEEQVRKMGKGLYMFIQDNPNLFIPMILEGGVINMDIVLLLSAAGTTIGLMAAVIGIEIYRSRGESSCDEFESFFED